MAGKQQRLGRGIDALIKDGTTAKKQAVTKKVAEIPAGAAEPAGGVQEVPVAKVVASPWQPRSVFESGALGELVESIKLHGPAQNRARHGYRGVG
jgi:ParB family chromosome partitioning protein